ncbi:MAG: hypothetical protein R6V12_13620 [Candidatus Hydrogenedentota bacterium]
MADEMIFSPDSKSLRRGKRIAPRTETCRPCLVWPEDAPDMHLRGVILDINAYGMLIRTMESLPPGMRLQVQLMRDDEFQEPLTKPVTAMVVRNILQGDGFVEHGVQVIQEKIRGSENKPFRQPLRKPRRRRQERARMHTRDLRSAGIKQRGRE